MWKEEEVVLVDENDHKLGTMEKIEAHEKEMLHRAFSVLIFNKKGKLLIQKRADEKYHCPGLWTNTICSHPRDGEDYEAGAHRRLREEIGFDCPLGREFCFVYEKKFDNRLTEHEYDCIFTGEYDGEIDPDPKEVSETRWISINVLEEEIKKSPDSYTEWFKLILTRLAK
jgi:isopentenyl-diphosphate delta-isomerase